MKRSWKLAALACALVVAVTASAAVAAQGDSRGDRGTDRAQRPAKHARHLNGLAAELGVSAAKLRSALRAAHEKVGPPDPPSSGRPSREDLEKHCNELTDALAAELDKSGDEVRAAIKAAIKKRIEADVDAERLTREQADAMLKRIDAAACLPAFGPGGRGCGGPGGRFMRGGPPPAGELRGSQRPGSSGEQILVPPPPA